MDEESTLEQRLGRLEDDWQKRSKQFDRLDVILDKFPSPEALQSFSSTIDRLHDMARAGRITGKGIFWAATLIGLWESTKQFVMGWWSIFFAHKQGGN